MIKLKKQASFEDMKNSLTHIDAFALVVLQQTDNHMSHAIVVSFNYIFDCNTSNALPFTLEGINCCCGKTANFKSFHSGYLFIPQTDSKAFKTWKNKKINIT